MAKYNIWTDDLSPLGIPSVLETVTASSDAEALLIYARNQGHIVSKKDIKKKSLELPEVTIHSTRLV